MLLLMQGQDSRREGKHTFFQRKKNSLANKLDSPFCVSLIFKSFKQQQLIYGYYVKFVVMPFTIYDQIYNFKLQLKTKIKNQIYVQFSWGKSGSSSSCKAIMNGRGQAACRGGHYSRLAEVAAFSWLWENAEWKCIFKWIYGCIRRLIWIH